MAWVNNKPARNSGNRHLIGGERQSSEKDLNKRFSNLLVLGEDGNSGILAELETEVKNLETKLEKLNKQQSALQLMWEMYLQKNDSHNAENVKQEQRNCKNEIQSLEVLKEQALSLLAKYGVLLGPLQLPPHREITLLWDWNGTNESQITAPRGRSLKLLNDSDPEWWLGEYGGKQGYFPSSYAYPVVYEARVLHDHTAGSPLELTVTSGTILDIIAVDDEWCSAEDSSTKKHGYIPRAYVEILSQAEIENLSSSDYNSGNSLKNSGEGSRSQESFTTESTQAPSTPQKQEPAQSKEQESQPQSTTTQETKPQETKPQETKPQEPAQEKSHDAPPAQVVHEPPKQESKSEEPKHQETTILEETPKETKTEPPKDEPKPQPTQEPHPQPTQEQHTQTTQTSPQEIKPQHSVTEQSTETIVETKTEPPKDEPISQPTQEQQSTQSVSPQETKQPEPKSQEPGSPQQVQSTPAPQETKAMEEQAKEPSGTALSSSGGVEGKPVPPPRATNLINAQYREAVTSRFSMSTHRIHALLEEEQPNVSLDFVQQTAQELKQQAQEEVNRLLNEAKTQIKQTSSHS